MKRLWDAPPLAGHSTAVDRSLCGHFTFTFASVMPARSGARAQPHSPRCLRPGWRSAGPANPRFWTRARAWKNAAGWTLRPGLASEGVHFWEGGVLWRAAVPGRYRGVLFFFLSREGEGKEVQEKKNIHSEPADDPREALQCGKRGAPSMPIHVLHSQAAQSRKAHVPGLSCYRPARGGRQQ